MGETILTTPQTWVEYIPAHRFVGLYDIHAKGYVDFEKREDFDRIEGILESMVPVQHPVVWAHHAGWFYNAGKKGYFYGSGVAEDYAGVIPEGFEVRDVPASYYLVFGHPKYDYMKDNGEVMKRVEELTQEQYNLAICTSEKLKNGLLSNINDFIEYTLRCKEMVAESE